MPDTVSHRLVYCSRAIIDGPDWNAGAEMARILEVSRRNNARDGVTGALLHGDGCFAQTLEGPLEAIERTFERIQMDPRHGAVTVLQIIPADRRLFGEWSMAHAGGGRPAALSTLLPSDDAREVVDLLLSLMRNGAE